MTQISLNLDILLGSSGETFSDHHYRFTRGTNLRPLLGAPNTQLSIQRQQLDNFDHLTITNVGEHVTLFIWLEDAHPVQSNNYVYWEDTLIDDRMIQIHACKTEQWSET